MKRVEVCDHRRAFVPAHQTVTQFFHASEATLLVITADQDIDARFDGRAARVRGGESLTVDNGAGHPLDLSTIELRAGDRKAEVNIMLSYTSEMSAVDQLADLAR